MAHIMARISEGSWEKKWNSGIGLMGDLIGDERRGVRERSFESWRGWYGERKVLRDRFDFGWSVGRTASSCLACDEYMVTMTTRCRHSNNTFSKIHKISNVLTI